MMLRLLARWMIGAVVATAIIAITSPWFIRSYLPRRIDPVRGVWTLPPEHVYRWRSEGYADSWIGPLGMPGARSGLLSNDPAMVNVALWGDSQAEGCSVADDEKIFAISNQHAAEAGLSLRVFPLARSGDDARDWLAQMSKVESELGIQAHVFLIVDLPDLAVAAEPFTPNLLSESHQRLVEVLPAFVLQAGRNLLTDADGERRRTLRFGIGPVNRLSAGPLDHSSSTYAEVDPHTQWDLVFRVIRRQTKLPVLVVYSPPVPIIMGGEIRQLDSNQPILEDLARAASMLDVTWIDVRPAMFDAAGRGDWPRGFQNGQIGVGHLNARGNRIVAVALINAIKQLDLGN